MNTVQKYSGEGDSTTLNEPSEVSLTPTAPSAGQTTPTVDSRQAPVTINEFLARNVPYQDMTPQQVGAYLHERLQAQPLLYSSILDVIPVLRKFLPASGADADYAFLIQAGVGQQALVTGFAWLGAQSYETAQEVEVRSLMQQILTLNTSWLVLATTWSVEETAFSPLRIREIDKVGESFAQFGVVLDDWLSIHPQHTESYMIAGDYQESLRDLLNADDVVFCYDHCTFPDRGDKEGEDDE